MSSTRETGARRRMAGVRYNANATLAIVLGLAAAAWTAVVGALAVWRHDQFLSHRFDLGNMAQAVWSTTQGRPLESTDGVTGEQIVRLAGHVDPILVLFAPLWLIFPQPETLIVAQAVALASGVYPVVRLALKHVGDSVAAALLGVWYLVFPWVVWNALNDVHPVTFAIPLLLYAVWFLDEHRLVPFAGVGGLALATGELVGLTVGALGVWYAIRHRRVRTGAGIAVAGFGWTAFCLTVVIPVFNDGRPSGFYGRFESVGGSPTGLITTLFTDPGAVYDAVTTTADARYVALLLVPTALIALGQPFLLLVAAPQLSVNLLSDFWSTTQPMYQYVAPIIAPLVAAVILAVGRLPKRARTITAALPLGAALLILGSMPPVPGGEEFVFGERELPARIDAMRAAIALVPADAPVSATNRLGAHLSERVTIHLFPNRDGAEWAVLDTRDAWLATAGEQTDVLRFQQLLLRFERDHAWRLRFDQEGIRVYQRQT